MHDPNEFAFDPVLGLEQIRRDIIRLSKSAFYGPKGLVHDLPVIELSAKRRGVRLSDLQKVLDNRTRFPNQQDDASASAGSMSEG